VDEWKVQNKTAIPHGRYRVIITRSERFSRKAGHDVYLPELLSVPGFDKIRIHGGNGPEDTDGCISSATSAWRTKRYSTARQRWSA
jgi:hypothetical protein